jgi:hypothetical protein
MAYSSSGSGPRNREASRNKASQLFKEKTDRNIATYQQMETVRLVEEAKIAKLRALRLAKEEADREAARIAQLNQPVVIKKKK